MQSTEVSRRNAGRRILWILDSLARTILKANTKSWRELRGFHLVPRIGLRPRVDSLMLGSADGGLVAVQSKAGVRTEEEVRPLGPSCTETAACCVGRRAALSGMTAVLLENAAAWLRTAGQELRREDALFHYQQAVEWEAIAKGSTARWIS
jgi:hypothetical protein